MNVKYQSFDNTWNELVLPSSLTDPEVPYQMEQLAARVEEVEQLIQGLADFAEVSV